jgi:hypothetical protein
MPFQQMIHSQLLHQILYFPSEFVFPWKQVIFENFNISEHNMIRVEMDPGTMGSFEACQKEGICQKFPIAILCIVVICVMNFYFN